MLSPRAIQEISRELCTQPAIGAHIEEILDFVLYSDEEWFTSVCDAEARCEVLPGICDEDPSNGIRVFVGESKLFRLLDKHGPQGRLMNWRYNVGPLVGLGLSTRISRAFALAPYEHLPLFINCAIGLSKTIQRERYRNNAGWEERAASLLELEHESKRVEIVGSDGRPHSFTNAILAQQSIDEFLVQKFDKPWVWEPIEINQFAFPGSKIGFFLAEYRRRIPQ